MLRYTSSVHAVNNHRLMYAALPITCVLQGNSDVCGVVLQIDESIKRLCLMQSSDNDERIQQRVAGRVRNERGSSCSSSSSKQSQSPVVRGRR